MQNANKQVMLNQIKYLEFWIDKYNKGERCGYCTDIPVLEQRLAELNKQLQSLQN